MSFLALSRALAACALVLAGVQGSAQTTVAIHDIMTNLPASPLLGQQVTVSGIVVGRLATGAFYITAPSSAWDTNTATAEGIEIFAAPACANAGPAVGSLVTVTGTVVNGTAVNGANTPGTGINPTACSVNGTGVVGAAVSLTSATSFAQDLAYTGMPVTNTVFYAVSPTSGTQDPATQQVTSTGQFWADLAVPTNGHLFKSTGLEADNFYPPPPAPPSPAIPLWAGNPQRLLIDTASFGGAPIDIGAGQTLTCQPGAGLTAGATTGVGIMDYSLGYNRLLLFKSTTCSVSGAIAPSITSPADSAHFHVGTINLNNFAGSSSPVYATRLAKAALALVNVFGKPEIVSVQEVQDLATLQAIGDAASALAGPPTSYKAYWSPANDATNLSLGFLVDTSAVAVSKTYQTGVADTFTQLNGSVVPLWERPPFVLEAGLLRAGLNYQVEVINIETTGRAGIDDPVNGPNIWERRGQQAEALSGFANAEQNRGQNLLIAGEFNAYSFSDGFVDVTDIVVGAKPPAYGTVAQYEPTLTSPAMYNFVNSITVPNSTYNVIEQGNARSIEHILCSETQNTSASGSIYSYISFVTQPHWTTDFPAVDANNPNIAAGLTARDGFVGAFLIPPVPTQATLSPANLNFPNTYRGTSASLPVTFTNSSTFPSTVNVQNVTITGSNPADFKAINTCPPLAQAAACTLTVTFAPTGTGLRTATLTLQSDSGANPTLTVTLSGIGLDTTATLTPASATYPTTATGTSSPAQSFTWTNSNPIPLAVFSVAVSGNFVVSANTCAGTIAPGASCIVSVVFAPLSTGPLSGTLTVLSASNANPTLASALSGVGVSNIVATPSPLAFGNVDLGATSKALPITLSNYSPHAISLSGAAVSGDFSFTNLCPASLASFAQCTVLVAFTPTALGARTGAFTVTTSDPGTPRLTVPLTGNGVDFSIAVAPASANVIAGYAKDFTATLTPLGGYAGTLQLSCAPPAGEGGSICSAGPTNPFVAAPTAANLHVTTTAQYTVIGYSGVGGPRSFWLALATALSALLLFLASTKARKLKPLLSAGALLILLASANLGCSGKLPARNPNPTLPGTYIYTVTATDGVLTHTATFSLTVTIK